MKYTLLLLLVSITATAQVKMEYDGGAKFQKVIYIDSATASELYKSVDRWILKTYRSPDKVVKARLENEEIRGEAVEIDGMILSEFPKAKNNLHYTFKIEVKDNRVRYTMYLMRGDANPVEAYIYKKDGTERTGGQATTVKNSVTEIANRLITSLENSLKEKSTNDW